MRSRGSKKGFVGDSILATITCISIILVICCRCGTSFLWSYVRNAPDSGRITETGVVRRFVLQGSSLWRRGAQCWPMPEGVVGDVAMPSAEDDLVAETAASDAKRDLDLPETDFTYLAGSTDRPWSHFLGRWRAIQPRLAEMLKNRGTRPQRICDVGACTGFFALQMAHRHPEADVIAVEGSVGIGNGTAGLNGGSRIFMWGRAK